MEKQEEEVQALFIPRNKRKKCKRCLSRRARKNILKLDRLAEEEVESSR